MKILEKRKPKGVREWVAMKLVRLARWIYPKSEAVLAFYTQLIHDYFIYGKSVVRINPKEVSKEKK